MSGSNSAALRGSQQRGSIRDLEAGRRPAYQIPIRRDAGQNYNYPGFGNDPEALTAGAKLAAAAGGQGAPGAAGGGGGSGGGDNPLLRGGDLASIIAGGGTGGGDGGFEPTPGIMASLATGMRPATLATPAPTTKPVGLSPAEIAQAARNQSITTGIASAAGGIIGGIIGGVIPGIGFVAAPALSAAGRALGTYLASPTVGGVKGEATADGGGSGPSSSGPGPGSPAGAAPGEATQGTAAPGEAPTAENTAGGGPSKGAPGPTGAPTAAPSAPAAAAPAAAPAPAPATEAEEEANPAPPAPTPTMTFGIQEVAPEVAPTPEPEAPEENSIAPGFMSLMAPPATLATQVMSKMDTEAAPETDVAEAESPEGVGEAKGGDVEGSSGGGTSTDGPSDSSGNSNSTGTAGGPGSDGQAGGTSTDGTSDSSGNSGTSAGAGAAGAGSGGGDGSSNSDGFRHGGYVSPDDDGEFEPVPTNVHEGEFVMRPEATAALGPQFLAMLNQQGGGPATLANTGRPGPAPMMPGMDDGEGMDNYEEYAEADEGEPWEQEHDSAMREFADRPYGDVAMAADPFSADAQTDLPGGAVTPQGAEQRLGTLPPEMQQMALATLGSDPMIASAMLHVLGPSFASLIRKGMPARPMMAGMPMGQGAPMMGGGAPMMGGGAPMMGGGAPGGGLAGIVPGGARGPV